MTKNIFLMVMLLFVSLFSFAKSVLIPPTVTNTSQGIARARTASMMEILINGFNGDAGLKAFVPSLAKYAGLGGRLKLYHDELISGFGGDPGDDYNNYNAATKTLIPELVNMELSKFYSTSVQLSVIDEYDTPPNYRNAKRILV